MSGMNEQVPSLYEWMGGQPALDRLIGHFYDIVLKDELLRPIFSHMSPAHVPHVSAFIAEVFGGPKTYSEQLGGHPHMIRAHLGKLINEAQRQRWLQLLLVCADEVGLPSDPEFRSAFVAYFEWGTRLAVMNSQPGVDAPQQSPMPRWGWGEVGGPYVK